MNDKITRIEFNVWAENDTDGAEVAKAIGEVINWYGQRGVKVTAKSLTEAINGWRSNDFIKQSIYRHLK